MPPPIAPALESPTALNPESAVLEAIDRLERALAARVDGTLSEAERETALADAVNAVAVLPRRTPPAALAESILTLARRVREELAIFWTSRTSDSALLEADRGWPALLARMLAGPAWRMRDVPRLGEVPDWMWAEYSAWLFAAPVALVAPHDAERFTRHALVHMEELARWVERNLGSPAVRAALDSYLRATQAAPFAVADADVRRQAELHGRIVAAASGAHRVKSRPTTERGTRKLRVGFVASHPAALPAGYRLLDSSRFEVAAFSLEAIDETPTDGADVALSAVLSLLRADNRTAKCRQLPAVLAEQMAELERENLDVIVFAEELALSSAPLTQLAAQRLAPLQVLIAPANLTSGLASIDLFVAGAAALQPGWPAHFTERCATIAGSGHGFGELAPVEVDRAGVRQALQLPADRCLVLTAARLREISAERLAGWIELLRAIPEVALAIQILPGNDDTVEAIEAFGARLTSALAAGRVDSSRVSILAAPISSLADLQNVVAAADIFLDGAAFGEPELLHVPLVQGVPIATLPGATLPKRQAAALLEALGLREGIATDVASLHERIAAWAADPAERLAMGAKQRAAVESAPLCRDPLAFADAFGGVVEDAYDRMHALGPKRFRATDASAPAALSDAECEQRLRDGAGALAVGQTTAAFAAARAILRCQPAHVGARVLVGRALLADDQPAAAIDYLLAAVQSAEDATVWLDLATALNRNGQGREAIQALETSLRLDGTRADAWVMLIEIARAAGADEIAREAVTALRQCAPGDPRLAALELPAA